MSGYKLFGSYTLPDNSSAVNEKKIIKKIRQIKKKSDLIIVTDYGHHFLNKNIASHIINSKTFVTVNAQVNSSTQGYNSVEKYAGANAIIINEMYACTLFLLNNKNSPIVIKNRYNDSVTPSNEFSIIFGLLLTLLFSGVIKNVKLFFVVFTFSVAWVSSSFLIYVIFR